MPISGRHDLPLATFNLPSRNSLQNKPNSAATMSLPCSRFATARWDAPPGKQHRHSGIFRVADLGPGTMPRGKYPESPAPAGSHALISRTPTPGGMLHANLGLPRPPPRNFQPSLPQQPPKQTQQRRHNVPPVQSLRDSAAATPVGCAAGHASPLERMRSAASQGTQRDGADETIGRILSHSALAAREGRGGGFFRKFA